MAGATAEAHAVEQVQRPRHRGTHGQPAVVARRHQHVVQRRHPGQQVVLLEDEAEPLAAQARARRVRSGLGSLDVEQLETVEAPSDATYYGADVAIVILSYSSQTKGGRTSQPSQSVHARKEAHNVNRLSAGH